MKDTKSAAQAMKEQVLAGMSFQNKVTAINDIKDSADDFAEGLKILGASVAMFQIDLLTSRMVGIAISEEPFTFAEAIDETDEILINATRLGLSAVRGIEDSEEVVMENVRKALAGLKASEKVTEAMAEAGIDIDALMKAAS